MTMRALLACIVVCAACGTKEAPTPRKPADLSPALMRQMMTAGKPCIEGFRGKQMPEPYETVAILRPDREGKLAVDFTSGDRAEFNACISDAIRAAAIPAEGVTAPTEIPLAFSFRQ